MLQTRSNVYLVAQVNTSAGGSAVIITNSQNLGVNVQNSAGWIFAQSNTGGAVAISNSAGWIVGISLDSINIVNSAGWIVNVANTVGSVNIINSAGWSVGVGSTSIVNSAGWVVSIANTSGLKTFSTLETSQMSSNGIAITAGFAIISASGTDNTIVSAVATKRIRILAFNMMSNVGNNAIFQSGTGASNLLTGTYFIGSNGGIVGGYNPMGWFQTSGNNLLNLKLSAAQSVGGSITYLEI